MKSEKRPFQFIRNKLRHRSFAVYCLCCLNNCKQNKLHWYNTHCCLLQNHCFVSSRNTLSLLPLRDESEQRLRGRIRLHARPHYQHLVTSAFSLARTYEVFRNMSQREVCPGFGTDNQCQIPRKPLPDLSYNAYSISVPQGWAEIHHVPVTLKQTHAADSNSKFGCFTIQSNKAFRVRVEVSTIFNC